MVNQRKQKGIVLITAMIMTVAVTGVALSLMSSSSIDLKISSAAQERAEAEAELLGEINEVIGANIFSPNNPFTKERQQIPDQGENMTPSGVENITNILRSKNNGEGMLGCSRRPNATDEGVRCIHTELVSVIEYGSRQTHNIQVVMGIEQEVIDHSLGN